MAWVEFLPGCLVRDGAFTVQQPCIWDATPGDIATFLGWGIGPIAAFGLVWVWRKGSAARKKLTAHQNWPEHSNLHSQPTPEHLVPRTELSALTDRLSRGQGSVVQSAVTGMGGMGKTTLALAAARAVANRYAGV